MITFTELLKRAKSEQIAIHTPTEEQAKALLKALDKRGYKWASRTKLTTETWHGIYKENTCYDFDLNKKVWYGPLSLYQKKDKIIEFTDIDFGNDDPLKKTNTLRIVYIVSMIVLFVSIGTSLLLFDLDNKIFFVLTIALSLILIGIGVVAEQKSEDNYDKYHDEEIKNIKLGYEKEFADEKKKLNAVYDHSLKLERKIEALRTYKKIYIDKSIKCDGVPSKESLLKDIGVDIDLLTPPTLTEDKRMDIKTIYHNKSKRQSQLIKFRNGLKNDK